MESLSIEREIIKHLTSHATDRFRPMSGLISAARQYEYFHRALDARVKLLDGKFSLHKVKFYLNVLLRDLLSFLWPNLLWLEWNMQLRYKKNKLVQQISMKPQRFVSRGTLKLLNVICNA